MEIRAYREADEGAVIELWTRCGLVRPWNDPGKDIARKRRVQRELFLVAVAPEGLLATVMAGYEGHRGWINYLAVDPAHQRNGLGRRMMDEAEERLRALGCPKINLQIRHDNLEARRFYERLGFEEDATISLGKRLEHDGP
jgi:ribosomal protein S18 acetylase RimI-like enzyme